MRQQLVLPAFLRSSIRPDPLRSLDIAIPVLARYHKFRLQAEFRIAKNFLDLPRCISCRFGQHDLTARFDLGCEQGTVTNDHERVGGGEGDAA